jgi:hypothetical protein
MFSTLRNYVSDRKSGIAKTAGFVGGLYIAKSYISDRLDEVKVRLEQERTAKDRQVCSSPKVKPSSDSTVLIPKPPAALRADSRRYFLYGHGFVTLTWRSNTRVHGCRGHHERITEQEQG